MRGAVLLFVLLVLALYVPLSPVYSANPTRDSGGFLYTAQQMLEGRLLYRDLWEHKPPVIFLLNALGLLIGGGSWWGVWILEVLFAAAAYFLLFRALRAIADPMPALVGCLACLAGWMALAQNFGNYAEEYALLFQIAALFLYARRDLTEFDKRDMVMFAACAAMAFLLKPTLVGVWVATALVSFARNATIRTVLRVAVVAGLSFAIIGLIILPFIAAGAGRDLFDQVVRYNSGYSAATTEMRLAAARMGVGTLLLSGAAIVALIYLVVLLINPRGQHRLIQAAMLNLPLELLAAAATGRPYRHYFFSLLPSIAILTAAALQRVARYRAVPAILGILIIARAVTWMSPIRQERFMSNDKIVLARDRVSAMLASVVPPDETVLVWGAEPSVNFLSHRRSPTRYGYQYPLMQRSYADAERVNEFLNELRAHPPAAIVDTSPTNPIVVPLDPRLWDRWRPTQPYVPPIELKGVIGWIQQNYYPVVVDESGWTVYRRRTR